MRKTGYILLILGFLRLAWVSFAIDALPRPLTQSDNEMFQSTNSYSGQQLRKMVIGVVANYHMCIPGVILPAALMLAGGVLLDQAARRDKKRKPQLFKMRDQSPPEKQDAQVVDNQRNAPVLFLESLPHLGGGWSAVAGAGGAFRSAVAVHVAGRRWLSCYEDANFQSPIK